MKLKLLMKVFFLLTAGFFFVHSPVFAQAKMNTTKKPAGESSKDITIHQEINFTASPQRLYLTLIDSKEFSRSTKKSFDNFSETSATIDSVAGGSFSLFDGHIIGRILELVPNQRVVEAWRVVDWPAGVYSIARFELKPAGSGTKLVFDHVGFPAGLKIHLSEGWQQHYWDAFRKYLQQG